MPVTEWEFYVRFSSMIYLALELKLFSENDDSIEFIPGEPEESSHF